MKYPKLLAIACCLPLFALTACDNEDGDKGYSNADIYGTWTTDKTPQGNYEAQDVEVIISENRILQKAARVIQLSDNQIISENSHTCLGYGELSMVDEALGHFEFYYVENLSFPSSASDNIRVELMDGGARATVTTKGFNSDGTETFIEFEVERVNDFNLVDDTSCTSQE